MYYEKNQKTAQVAALKAPPNIHVDNARRLPLECGYMALFGTSGIRRRADRTLFEIAFKVGLATGTRYRRLVIGNDCRTSSEALKHAILAGILAAGAEAHDAGTLPTPTVAIAGRHFGATVMITASHNPPEYNGIKLLNPDGSSFSPKQQAELERDILDTTAGVTRWEHFHNSETYPGAIEEHIAHIRQFFPGEYRLKVVLDCAGAAASVITPSLLRQLGCELICLNCNPTGFFPHPVEPIAENLSELMEQVRQSGADLGIAHDGDADRMMAVDGQGRFISGDRMLCLMAKELNARQVVTTIDASMAADQAGFTLTRTAVGDNAVCEALREGGDFGGEPSGAWIFPRSSLCPDGIFAAALVVAIASRSRLADLADALPEYPIYRGSFPGSGANLGLLEERLASAYRPLSISRIDGLKFVLNDSWFLIRPSGTEPKVRLTVEATTRERLDELKNQLVDIIKGCV